MFQLLIVLNHASSIKPTRNIECELTLCGAGQFVAVVLRPITIDYCGPIHKVRPSVGRSGGLARTIKGPWMDGSCSGKHKLIEGHKSLKPSASVQVWFTCSVR